MCLLRHLILWVCVLNFEDESFLVLLCVYVCMYMLLFFNALICVVMIKGLIFGFFVLGFEWYGILEVFSL